MRLLQARNKKSTNLDWLMVVVLDDALFPSPSGVAQRSARSPLFAAMISLQN
jgi:hypothetical protein